MRGSDCVAVILCEIVGRHEDAIVHYAAGLRLEPGHVGITRRLLRAMGRLGIGSQPAMLTPDVPLHFGRGEAGVASLRDGWALPENGGVWSLGCEASVVVGLPYGDARLRRLSCELGVRLDAAGIQRVEIYAGGQQVGIWTFDAMNANGARCIDLPSSFVASGSVRLRILCERPCSMPGDPRFVKFYRRSMTLNDLH